MCVTVARPGLLTTVQDLGRYGSRRFGVGPGGAMDRLSAQVANVLVRNDPSAALLELTLNGPELRFNANTLIAITGADLCPRVAGEAVPMWRPVQLAANTLLSFGQAISGCRSYLAVAGGIDVPEVLGSRSTDLIARIGGFNGRALQAGDELNVCNVTSPQSQKLPQVSTLTWGHIKSVAWSTSLRPAMSDRVTLRVLRGPEFDWMTTESQRSFFEQDFAVTTHSNRIGYRLKSERLELSSARQMLSDSVVPGTLQLPADGQAVLLMVDCATTGGYPRVANVIDVDLQIAAQLKPSDTMNFKEVSLAKAHRLLRQQELEVQKLTVAIDLLNSDVA